MEQAHQQYVNAHHQRQTLNQGEPLQQLTIKTTSLIHTTEPQAHVSLDAAHWMEANELVVFNPVEGTMQTRVEPHQTHNRHQVSSHESTTNDAGVANAMNPPVPSDL